VTVLANAGSFAKATGAATATQTGIISTGFGAQPKALILMCEIATSDQTATGGPAAHAFGFSTPSAARSFSGASGASGITTKAYKRAAAKALTIVNATGTTLAECDATFNSDGTIDLAWTTNDSNAYRVRYLALGGTSLSASIVEWASLTATGSKSITGAGFQPNAALTIGDDLDNALPRGGTFETHMFGATDGTNSWAMAGWTQDGAVGSTTARIFIIDDGVDALADNTNRTHATFTSWDSDGMTLNYDVVQGWQTTHASKHATLFLAGATVKAGKFSKSSSSGPVTDTISTPSLQPRALILAMGGSLSASDSAVQNSWEHSVGLSDGTNSTSTWSAYAHNQASSANGNAEGGDGWGMISTNPGTINHTGTASLNNGSFAITWNPNDASATDVFYLAIGEAGGSAFPWIYYEQQRQNR